MDQAQDRRLSDPGSVLQQFGDLHPQNEVNHPYPAGLRSRAHPWMRRHVHTWSGLLPPPWTEVRLQRLFTGLRELKNSSSARCAWRQELNCCRQEPGWAPRSHGADFIPRLVLPLTGPNGSWQLQRRTFIVRGLSPSLHPSLNRAALLGLDWVMGCLYTSPYWRSNSVFRFAWFESFALLWSQR